MLVKHFFYRMNKYFFFNYSLPNPIHDRYIVIDVFIDNKMFHCDLKIYYSIKSSSKGHEEGKKFGLYKNWKGQHREGVCRNGAPNDWVENCFDTVSTLGVIGPSYNTTNSGI
jgi:hypothetical protein